MNAIKEGLDKITEKAKREGALENLAEIIKRFLEIEQRHQLYSTRWKLMKEFLMRIGPKKLPPPEAPPQDIAPGRPFRT